MNNETPQKTEAQHYKKYRISMKRQKCMNAMSEIRRLNEAARPAKKLENGITIGKIK